MTFKEKIQYINWLDYTHDWMGFGMMLSEICPAYFQDSFVKWKKEYKLGGSNANE